MQRQQSNPPGSGKLPKKQLDLAKISSYLEDKTQPINSNAFVLGISGGDCAGKKELIQYMLNEKDGEFFVKSSDEPVTLIHQDYFILDRVKRFTSKGTDWDRMEKAVLNILAGNEFMVKNAKLKETDLLLKPARLVIIEGSHIFMENHPIYKYIDSKIFIDSDSDVRLSRRIYKDTQDDGMDLNESISNYLENIKPSYDSEIEPCKIKSDIIIPHFGGGYDDHRKESTPSLIQTRWPTTTTSSTPAPSSWPTFASRWPSTDPLPHYCNPSLLEYLITHPPILI